MQALLTTQDDAELLKDDPFDTAAATATEAGAAEDQALAMSLLDIDARLQQYAEEHLWDDTGSLCDFRFAVSP